MADKWDWLKDEISGFKAISKLPVILKFLRGKTKGADDITKCTLCPNMCRHACPVGIVDGKETTSPSGKSRIGFLVREGVLSESLENLYPLYMCLSCGCCESWCPFDFSVSDILQPFKQKAVENRVVFDKFKPVFENLKKDGYVYDKKPDDNISGKESNGKILYLRGCVLREHYPDIPKKAINVLEKISKDNVSFLNDEKCCGIPAYNLGDVELFKKIASENTEVLNNSGYEVVITSCPTCAYAYRILYPSMGFEIKPRVYHMSEYLLEHKESLRIKSKNEVKVTFHDPCKIVHGLGKPDVLHNVLVSVDGLEVVKPRRFAEETFCCGYGGSSICLLNQKLADDISTERLDELKKLADIIVTACPSCKQSFDENKKDDNLQVLDVSELLELLSLK